jgi:putative transposase
MGTRYQTRFEGASTVKDALEEMAREGARSMLQRALEEEVAAFLGRERYERGGEFRGYRNGSHPERTIGTGMGSVAVRVPRVREVPEALAAAGYQSQLVQRYQRRSHQQQRLFSQLYLEGLSSGDFEPVFRQLLGEDAPLSESSMLRLRGEWEQEYRAFRLRPLRAQRYAYLWFDGIYVGCGQEREKTVLLCVLGAREDGQKELLALEEGYRESTASWSEVLRSLRERGLRDPLLGVGDGALGAWAALDEVYPETRRQRCWNHRVMNIQDQVPKRLQAEVRTRLRELWEAESRVECERRRDLVVAWLREEGQERAAQTVLRDWDDFVSFYDFPREHWLHLRTSNAIESVFAGVRLRTRVAKRMQRRENALYLVFKVIERLGQNWRALNGGQTVMTLVLAGEVFKDGVLQREHGSEGQAA